MADSLSLELLSTSRWHVLPVFCISENKGRPTANPVCSGGRCPGVITMSSEKLSATAAAPGDLLGELCGANWPFWGPGVLWDVPFIAGLHRCCSRRAELKQLVLWVGLSVQCQWVLVPQGEPKLRVLTWNYLLRISTTPYSEPEYLFSSIQQFQ